MAAVMAEVGDSDNGGAVVAGVSQYGPVNPS